jgi:hypothetical protein
LFDGENLIPPDPAALIQVKPTNGESKQTKRQPHSPSPTVIPGLDPGISSGCVQEIAGSSPAMTVGQWMQRARSISSPSRRRVSINTDVQPGNRQRSWVPACAGKTNL